jgi:hypothetical protein
MKQIFICLSIERDRDVLDHQRMLSLGRGGGGWGGRGQVCINL